MKIHYFLALMFLLVSLGFFIVLPIPYNAIQGFPLGILCGICFMLEEILYIWRKNNEIN